MHSDIEPIYTTAVFATIAETGNSHTQNVSHLWPSVAVSATLTRTTAV